MQRNVEDHYNFHLGEYVNMRYILKDLEILEHEINQLLNLLPANNLNSSAINDAEEGLWQTYE